LGNFSTKGVEESIKRGSSGRLLIWGTEVGEGIGPKRLCIGFRSRGGPWGGKPTGKKNKKNKERRVMAVKGSFRGVVGDPG